MNQNKTDGIIKMVLSGFGLCSLYVVIPAMLDLIQVDTKIYEDFHWWDKASFMISPFVLLIGFILMGLQGCFIVKNSR